MNFIKINYFNFKKNITYIGFIVIPKKSLKQIHFNRKRYKLSL